MTDIFLIVHYQQSTMPISPKYNWFSTITCSVSTMPISPKYNWFFYDNMFSFNVQIKSVASANLEINLCCPEPESGFSAVQLNVACWTFYASKTIWVNRS